MNQNPHIKFNNLLLIKWEYCLEFSSELLSYFLRESVSPYALKKANIPTQIFRKLQKITTELWLNGKKLNDIPLKTDSNLKLWWNISIVMAMPLTTNVSFFENVFIQCYPLFSLMFFSIKILAILLSSTWRTVNFKSPSYTTGCSPSVGIFPVCSRINPAIVSQSVSGNS